MSSTTRRFDSTRLRLFAAPLMLAVAAIASQNVMAQTPETAPGMSQRGMGTSPGSMPHGGMHHGGKHHGGMRGHRMDRALESVGATAEQRAQIQQIMQAAHVDLKAQREARKSLREQSQALFAQPNIDARAAESLRQQMQALRELSSKRMLQARLDAARVLSAEQRKALADKMTQHRSMMQRHRAERESMGTPRTR